jgi:hypothetical protein
MLFIIFNIFVFSTGIIFLVKRKKVGLFQSYAKLLIVNIIYIFVVMLILESIFGNWFSPVRLNQLNIIKNTRIQFVNNLYPWISDTLIYTRDQYGLRGTYPSVSEIDIVAIGGSTTDERYISDGYTWTSILQNSFLNNGKKVFVSNAGLDGQSTFGHIKNFDWWFPLIPEFKPKYVIAFIGINDFYIVEESKFNDLINENPGTNIKKLQKLLRGRSALYYLYRTISGMILSKLYKIGHGYDNSKFEMNNWVNVAELKNHDYLMEDHIKQYRNNLQVLSKSIKNFGSEPIFVTQSMRRLYNITSNRIYGMPNAGQYRGKNYNGVDYYIMSRLINKETIDVCEEIRGICLDLDSEINYDLDNDFYDRLHTTPSGSKKIGDFIYQSIHKRIIDES